MNSKELVKMLEKIEKGIVSITTSFENAQFDVNLGVIGYNLVHKANFFRLLDEGKEGAVGCVIRIFREEISHTVFNNGNKINIPKKDLFAFRYVKGDFKGLDAAEVKASFGGSKKGETYRQWSDFENEFS